MELSVWSEKYRPVNLKDVINQKHVVERLQAFAKEKNIPHLLFAGPAGTGKTTTGLAVARELYGENLKGNVLELNASDERGIDVIRKRVKNFARSPLSTGKVGFRVIILDEADALTQEAQQALRRTMENYTKDSRFILICNWSSKIIEPIQSRCAVFRFRALQRSDIEKFINRIVEGEKLKITPDAIDTVIEITEGDMRRVANLLQSCASVGEKITDSIVYDVASKAKPNDVKEMLNFALVGNFSEARTKLQDLLLKQGLAGNDIISEIHKQIYSLSNVDEKIKIELIEKCGEYEFRLSEGSNELIQLEALLAQFMLAGKK